MSPERRKLVLLLIAIVIAVFHLIDEAPDTVQLWPQQTVVNLQHALTTAQAASAAMLSQLSYIYK